MSNHPPAPATGNAAGVPPKQELSALQQEVLKLLFETRSTELRAETDTAFKLISGFITIELALMAWLSSHPPTSIHGSWGVFILNLGLGVFAMLFVLRNYGRRLEIIRTLNNVSDAWQLNTPGAYLPDRPILAEPFGHSWRALYLFVITFFCLAQAIPIFRLVRWDL